MKHFLNRHFREQWHQSKRQTRCLPNPEQPTLLHYESEVFQTIWILYSKRLYLNTSVDFRLLSLCKQWTIKQDCSSSHANTSLTNCVGQERFATGIGLETEITRIRQRAWFFTWRTMDTFTVVSHVDKPSFGLYIHMFCILSHRSPEQQWLQGVRCETHERFLSQLWWMDFIGQKHYVTWFSDSKTVCDKVVWKWSTGIFFVFLFHDVHFFVTCLFPTAGNGPLQRKRRKSGYKIHHARQERSVWNIFWENVSTDIEDWGFVDGFDGRRVKN